MANKANKDKKDNLCYSVGNLLLQGDAIQIEKH